MNYNDLYPFQKEGVAFLTSGVHKYLCDEMGLGKTPQAVVALAQIEAKSALIICPVSIKDTWAFRLVEWGAAKPSEIFIVRTGKDVIPDAAKFIIVNGDYLNSKNDMWLQLNAREYDAIIIDEAQRFKSVTGKRSKMLFGHTAHRRPLIERGRYKWLLSGTPMPNRPFEMYIPCRTLVPELIEPYTTQEGFGVQFCAGFKEYVRGGQQVWNFKGASNVLDLKKRLESFLLRREVADVWKEIPDLIETTVHIDIGNLEYDETNTPSATLRRMVGEAKLPYSIKFINDHIEDNPDDKLLVFGYHIAVTEGLAAGINAQTRLINGSTSAKDRAKAIHDFINDPEVKVLVCQLHSCAEGIDGLQKVCKTIILCEPEWSTIEDQAIARIWRMGQTESKVFSFKLVASQTIEVAICGTYNQKKRVIDLFLSPNNKGDQIMSVGLEEILNELKEIKNLLSSNAQGAAPPADKTTKDAPATESGDKKAKKEPAKEKAADSKTATTSPTNGKNSQTGSPSLTLEDVKKVAVDVLDQLSGGDKSTEASENAARKKLSEAISKTGAAKLGEVPEDQFEKLIGLFQDLLKQPVAAGDALGDL